MKDAYAATSDEQYGDERIALINNIQFKQYEKT